jgi:hypothetical protein
MVFSSRPRTRIEGIRFSSTNLWRGQVARKGARIQAIATWLPLAFHPTAEVAHDPIDMTVKRLDADPSPRERYGPPQAAISPTICRVAESRELRKQKGQQDSGWWLHQRDSNPRLGLERAVPSGRYAIVK